MVLVSVFDMGPLLQAHEAWVVPNGILPETTQPRKAARSGAEAPRRVAPALGDEVRKGPDLARHVFARRKHQVERAVVGSPRGHDLHEAAVEQVRSDFEVGQRNQAATSTGCGDARRALVASESSPPDHVYRAT